MGTIWEVWSYVPNDTVPNAYQWDEVYRGNSLIAAILAARREKKRYGLGCIRVEWR